MALKDHLERGYFPKELPRPFITRSFATLMTTALPSSGDWLKKPLDKTVKSGKLGTYSLARGGLLRRQLSICNPLHLFRLAKEIDDNWALIEPKVAGTPLSATAPVWKATGRALDGRSGHSDRPKLAQLTRLGRRFILRTDIARFYHSVYTHSLAWAAHSKVSAKSLRRAALVGNHLDALVQRGQDSQTIGIPIGPDSSLLLAELIMQRCDEELLKRLPHIKGFRFIDDYELSFSSRTEAEDAFHCLESCLSDFELALNPKKTEILDLPLPFEAAWASELKRLPIRTAPKPQAADLQSIFNRAFELHRAYPEESVLQFLLARFRKSTIAAANWDLFQLLVLNCVVPEPATLPYALEQIILRTNAGATPNRDAIAEVLNRIIETHSRRGHSSEVANAAWGCLALDVSLEKPAVDAISTVDNSVVALLALDLQSQRLITSPLDPTIWAGNMTQDALYGSHWLLSYEANVKGWLPSVGAKDHVLFDKNFAYLKSNEVSFYDQRLGRSPTAGRVSLPTLPTNTVPIDGGATTSV